MGIGKDIETRGHIVGFREEIASAAEAGQDDFFGWFNNDADMESSMVRAKWDFAYHVARHLLPRMREPHTQRVLEIGCDGGRLLSAAAGYFGRAAGTDIHDQLPRVKEILARRCAAGVELRRTDGSSIPFEDASFDAVYSFIVLQHVERIEIMKRYFAETFRVLRPGGLAMLYVGRHCRLSANRSSRLLLAADMAMERLSLRGGYKELAAKVNETNLRVTLPFARKIARETGFALLSWTVSRKNLPDGYARFGGQYGLLLEKGGGDGR